MENEEMSMHKEEWIAFAVKYQTPLAAVVAFILGYVLGKF